MNLNWTTTFNDELKVWNVKLNGEIDIYTAPLLKDEIDKIYEENQENIILDFSELKYIDSTGLGIIIGAYGRLKEKGKEIKIINPKSNITKLLSITALDKIFLV